VLVRAGAAEDAPDGVVGCWCKQHICLPDSDRNSRWSLFRSGQNTLPLCLNSTDSNRSAGSASGMLSESM
jgi:hypothetical protein